MPETQPLPTSAPGLRTLTLLRCPPTVAGSPPRPGSLRESLAVSSQQRHPRASQRPSRASTLPGHCPLLLQVLRDSGSVLLLPTLLLSGARVLGQAVLCALLPLPRPFPSANYPSLPAPEATSQGTATAL